MLPWPTLDADAVLRIKCREAQRLTSVPSSAGVDELGKMPHNAPGGEWVTVILLTRKVPASAWPVLQEWFLGAMGTVEVEVERIPSAYASRAEYDAAEPAERGSILRWTELQAVPMSMVAIAKRHHATPEDVRRLMARARTAVTEALGDWRGRR